MDLGGVVNRHFQQTKNDMYQNSGYCDSRTSKQILNLNIIPSVKTFSVDLFEPLRIDTLSDVYLDNFTTINAVQNTFASKQAFVLSIDQFPIKTNSNNSKLYNKIVIPNEETKDSGLQVHKARKLNYIASINPQTLTKITGSITDMTGGGWPIDQGALITDSMLEFPIFSIDIVDYLPPPSTLSEVATGSDGGGENATLTIGFEFSDWPNVFTGGDTVDIILEDTLYHGWGTSKLSITNYIGDIVSGPHTMIPGTLTHEIVWGPVTGVQSIENFGAATSINTEGNIIAVSSPFHNEGGVAYVGTVRFYKKNIVTGIYMEHGRTPALQSIFIYNSIKTAGRYSIELNGAGDILVVSSLRTGAGSKGQIAVFKNVATTVWTLLGSVIVAPIGTPDPRMFGLSFALDEVGYTLVTGNPFLGTSSGPGSIDIFEYNTSSNTWVHKTTIPGLSAGNEAGQVVCINKLGNRISFTSTNHDTAIDANTGRVRVFNKDSSNNWNEDQSTPFMVGDTAQDKIGASNQYMDMNKDDGTVICALSCFSDNTPLTNNGSVKIWKYNTTTTPPQWDFGGLIQGTTSDNDDNFQVWGSGGPTNSIKMSDNGKIIALSLLGETNGNTGNIQIWENTTSNIWVKQHEWFGSLSDNLTSHGGLSLSGSGSLVLGGSQFDVYNKGPGKATLWRIKHIQTITYHSDIQHTEDSKNKLNVIFTAGTDPRVLKWTIKNTTTDVIVARYSDGNVRVNSVQVENPGSGYSLGDILTVNNSHIDGTDENLDITLAGLFYSVSTELIIIPRN